MRKSDLKIKLCGFRDKESIDFACQFDIDFMGFVFYDKSPRNVDVSNIAQNINDIPENIKKVAVLVDASDDLITKVVNELKPDLLQLHGDENVERCEKIKEKFNLPIIKAFRISSNSDLEKIEEFDKVADYFLFDAKVGGQKGGSGEVFDWNILSNFNVDKSWLLSGGINADNLDEALQKTNAQIVDLSSALEEERGIKSKMLIRKFIQKLKD